MLALVLALALDVERTMDAATLERALNDSATAQSMAYAIRSETPMVVISTPYARVASIGDKMRKEYRLVSPADLPGEVVALTFDVYAAPYKGRPDVQRVVLAAKDGTIIQPIKEEPDSVGGGRSISATFPLEALIAGTEIRVVTSTGEERVKITPEFLAKIR